MTLQQEIKKKIPILDDRRLLEEVVEKGTLREMEVGTSPIQYGQYIQQVPIVLDGLIKITSQNDKGEEVLLYYLQKGSSCPTAFNCCMANRPSEIQATIEETTRVISIPIALVDEWLVKYQSWKNFVMNSYCHSFSRTATHCRGHCLCKSR